MEDISREEDNPLFQKLRKLISVIVIYLTHILIYF